MSTIPLPQWRPGKPVSHTGAHVRFRSHLGSSQSRHNKTVLIRKPWRNQTRMTIQVVLHSPPFRNFQTTPLSLHWLSIMWETVP